MLVTYFPEQVSLAGRVVMSKFIESVRQTDQVITNTTNADVAVIWSVLWQGRMEPNREIYHHFRSQNKPVVILETGNLIRGQTFKVCVNNINNQGIHAGQFIDVDRTHKFSQVFVPKRAGENILICCQQQNSLLWQDQPHLVAWVEQLIARIREKTPRPIEIRPHPRQQVDFRQLVRNFKKVTVVDSVRDYKNDTVDFDAALSRAYCVVGHNSGGLIESGIKHVPIVAHSSSLATSISNSLSCIDQVNPLTSNDWLKFIANTEWFSDEIAAGIPWQSLRSNVLREVC